LVSGDFCAVAECLIGRHIFELHGDPVIGIAAGFDEDVHALLLGIEFAAFDAQELDGFCECGFLELHLGEDDLVRLDLGGACFLLGLKRVFIGRRLGNKRLRGRFAVGVLAGELATDLDLGLLTDFDGFGFHQHLGVIGVRRGGFGDAKEGEEHDAETERDFHDGMRVGLSGDGLNARTKGDAALEDADEAEAAREEGGLDFEQGVAVFAAAVGAVVLQAASRSRRALKKASQSRRLYQ